MLIYEISTFKKKGATTMIGIYVRVSTEDQAKKGYSLKDQIEACKQKANGETMEYVEEGVSGEILDRPVLMKLRHDVKEGIINKVICLDPDRLARKLMNQLIITEEIEKHAELVFVNGEYAKTPEGMLFYQMRGAVAEFEKAKINERMSRGRRQKAREGKVVKNSFHYGYDYDKENACNVINEQEAEIVRLVFDLFTKPNSKVQGINGIAKYLTAQGIPTKRGAKQWHRQVVRQMLYNTAYIGELYQNRWNTEGMGTNKYKAPEDRVKMKERPKEEWIQVPTPPIIDEVTFYKAQQLLNQSRRRWAKQGLRTYLLSGLLRCGECSNTLTGRVRNNWGDKIRFYTCQKNTAGAKHSGCNHWIKSDKIEDAIWETVIEWINDPEKIVEASNQDTPDYEQHELKRIEEELDKTKKARSKLISLYAMVEGSAQEEVLTQLKDLQEKEKRLHEQLEKFNNVKKVVSNEEHRKLLLEEAAAFYYEHQDKLTIEDRQNIIRGFVKEIIVYKDEQVEIITL